MNDGHLPPRSAHIGPIGIGISVCISIIMFLFRPKILQKGTKKVNPGIHAPCPASMTKQQPVVVITGATSGIGKYECIAHMEESTIDLSQEYSRTAGKAGRRTSHRACMPQ